MDDDLEKTLRARRALARRAGRGPDPVTWKERLFALLILLAGVGCVAAVVYGILTGD